MLPFCPYHFVRTICPYHFVQWHFCPYTSLSIPFCPYHFVRYHFVRSPINVGAMRSTLEQRIWYLKSRIAFKNKDYYWFHNSPRSIYLISMLWPNLGLIRKCVLSGYPFCMMKANFPLDSSPDIFMLYLLKNEPAISWNAPLFSAESAVTPTMIVPALADSRVSNNCNRSTPDAWVSKRCLFLVVHVVASSSTSVTPRYLWVWSATKICSELRPLVLM